MVPSFGATDVEPNNRMGEITRYFFSHLKKTFNGQM